MIKFFLCTFPFCILFEVYQFFYKTLVEENCTRAGRSFEKHGELFGWLAAGAGAIVGKKACHLYGSGVFVGSYGNKGGKT